MSKEIILISSLSSSSIGNDIYQNEMYFKKEMKDPENYDWKMGVSYLDFL